MEPINAGPFTFYPFGIAVALLLVPSALIMTRGMKKRGLKQETAGWMAVLSVPLCFITARIGYCLLIIDQIIEADDYLRIFRVWEGGFLLWGAIVGLLIAAWIAGKATGQRTGKISDSVTVPACLMIAAIRLLCGLMFTENGIGFALSNWFDPDETDIAKRFSLWILEDYSFFERFPFAAEDFYGNWCWAIFVLEAIWAFVMAWITSRCRAREGSRTVLFVLLYACSQILWESMICNQVIYLPWQGFVKANQILCAIALVIVIFVCLRHLKKGERGKETLICFAQVIPAIGIVVAMEFAALEKKITMIETWPADVCFLIMGLACLWMGLAANRVRKKAYALHSGDTLVQSR